MNKELIEKIQKLLALATSDNENEARLASSKAAELMTKYNLNMQELNYEGLSYDRHVLISSKRRGLECKYVLPIIEKYYNVYVIRSLVVKGNIIYIVGDETNVEIARYVYGFLTNSFKQLFKKYRKDTGAPLSSRGSYYNGLSKGFRLQMDEAKAKAEAEKGLVVIKDPALDKAFREYFPHVKYKAANLDYRDSSAMNRGINDGKNIRIHKGMSSSNNTDMRYLK